MLADQFAPLAAPACNRSSIIAFDLHRHWAQVKSWGVVFRG